MSLDEKVLVTLVTRNEIVTFLFCEERDSPVWKYSVIDLLEAHQALYMRIEEWSLRLYSLLGYVQDLC